MTINKNIITADEGFVLTNGEAYGEKIYLSSNDTLDNWHEITEEEYSKIEEERNNRVIIQYEQH